MFPEKRYFPELFKYELLVDVCEKRCIDKETFFAFRQKFNRDEMWWLLFHCARLALETFQLGSALAYVELLQ